MILVLFMEAVIGKRVEKMGTATPTDVASYIRSERALHRLERLDLLARRMDLEVQRRQLVGVMR